MPLASSSLFPRPDLRRCDTTESPRSDRSCTARRTARVATPTTLPPWLAPRPSLYPYHSSKQNISSACPRLPCRTVSLRVFLDCDYSTARPPWTLTFRTWQTPVPSLRQHPGPALPCSGPVSPLPENVPAFEAAHSIRHPRLLAAHLLLLPGSPRGPTNAAQCTTRGAFAASSEYFNLLRPYIYLLCSCGACPTRHLFNYSAPGLFCCKTAGPSSGSNLPPQHLGSLPGESVRQRSNSRHPSSTHHVSLRPFSTDCPLTGHTPFQY